MNWKKELANNITTVDELEKALQKEFSKEEKEKLNEIVKQYPLSIPHYYLSLIDKDDENDPIRKLCIPSTKETDLTGSFDTSGESNNTVVVGLQHKYKQTGLLLSTNQCAMYCRHCFRKRLVGLNSDEIMNHLKEIIAYIKEHDEINNVLISGGDAFLNNNRVIHSYLEDLSSIEHLDLIRFGTRTPVTFPMRINGDQELLNILREYSRKKKIYVVTHFNHPNEITKESIKAVKNLLNSEVVLKNQTVLLKGVNDNPDVLATLINKLTAIGINPYYIFQCRPVSGVKNQFQLPLKEGYHIVEKTKSKLNGHGKCFRYVMSNKRGKIEILGNLSDTTMLFKFHEAKYDKDMGKIFQLDIKDEQCWIEEASIK